MARIETFVVFDLETTGLPHQEYNRTKITEMSLVAAARKDIRRTTPGELPPTCKLSFMLNPQRQISPNSSKLTGITNDLVKNCPTFKEKYYTIKGFLKDLKKPVCLVAHNGNIFDYKILLAECLDANIVLPEDLLCIDSLIAFRKIYKHNKSEPNVLNKSVASLDKTDASNDALTDLMPDDEVKWPDLNVTPEEFQEIDDLCSSFQNVSTNETKGRKPKNVRKTPQQKEPLPGFKLTDIYTRYFGSIDGKTAHRAEDDCLMLLQCMVVARSADASGDFLKWADENCKLLSEITPLKRCK